MHQTGKRVPAATRWAVFATVILLVVVALHARGWPGGFLSDDFSHLDWIYQADRTHGLGRWVLERFWRPLESGNFAWRPIAFASFALDWRLFGTAAAGWHVESLVLHLANVVLVGFLAWKWSPDDPGVRAAAAALSAAIFAAFPFAGEVTFWLVGRFDLLAAFFALLFLATFRSGDAAAGPLRQSLRVAFLIGALLAKESAMPLPFVALPICAALASRGEGVSVARARTHSVAVCRARTPAGVDRVRALRRRAMDAVRDTAQGLPGVDVPARHRRVGRPDGAACFGGDRAAGRNTVARGRSRSRQRSRSSPRWWSRTPSVDAPVRGCWPRRSLPRR